MAGSVVLAVYTMSVWPEMLGRVVQCEPAKVLPLGMLLAILEVLFLVWTVAFNFVPGGVLTRERTGTLIGIVMTGIAIGLFSGR